MGQAVGLPNPVEGVKPFTNLPRDALESLWTSYNLLGEGWGLDLNDFKSILRGATHLEKNIGLTDINLTKLFDAFDTDFNNLIDALETLTTIAIISGMDIVDKIFFSFSLYDFEGSGQLSFDAITLVLRSAVKGLSKVCPNQVALANAFDEIESFVELLFRSVGRPLDGTISATEFQTYGTAHPVISSWLKFFSSIPFADESREPVLKGLHESCLADIIPAPVKVSSSLKLVKRAVQPVSAAAAVTAHDFNEDHKPSIRSLIGGPKDLSPEVLAAKEAAAKAAEVAAAAAEAAKVEAEKAKLEAEAKELAKEGEPDGEGKGEGEEDPDAEADAEAEPEPDAAEEAEEEEQEEGEQGEGEGEEGEEDGAPKKKEKVIKLPLPNPFPSSVAIELSQDLLPWAAKADLLQPEEVPPFRVDKPEDTFEPIWIHGIGFAGSGFRRIVHYNAADSILYPASRVAVSLKQQVDEGGAPIGWGQTLLSEHRFPITCCDVDPSGRFFVTGDAVPTAGVSSVSPLSGLTATTTGGTGSGSDQLSRIVVWDTADNTVIASFSVEHGVRQVDFSPSGRKVLALLADPLNTVHIYDIATKTVVFSAPLSDACADTQQKVKIADVRFTGTDAMFAYVGTEGVVFYIEEGANFLGPASLKSYERRKGLYQAVGKEAVGVVATAVSKLQHPDETVVGNALGQVTLWRGRSCTQLLHAHTAAVTGFSYAPAAGILASAGKDNKIKIYKILDPTAASTGVAQKKGPRLLQDRSLEIITTIDLLTLGDIDGRVSAISLHSSGEKILVLLDGGELRELACGLKLKGAFPEKEAAAAATVVEGEEGEAAAAAPEGDGDEEGQSNLRFGQDINNGPIAFSHWRNGKGAGVMTVARVPGGFVTAGRDGVVNLWQTAEGAPNTRLKSAKIIGGGADLGLINVTVSPTHVIVAADAGAWKDSVTDGEANESGELTGLVQLFTVPDLTPVSRLAVDLTGITYSSKENWLHDLKVSPDGNTVALATADGKVSLYVLTAGDAPPADAAPPTEGVGVGPQLVHKTTFDAHGAALIDFSVDGAYLRSTDSTQKSLFVWDLSGASAAAAAAPVDGGEDGGAEDGAAAGSASAGPVELTNIEILRSLLWNSSSVPVNWDLKGAWNTQVTVSSSNNSLSFEPITAADRSQHLFVSFHKGSAGAVTVSRVPAPLFTATPNAAVSNQQFFSAHSGRVSSLTFVEEGAKLVTVGSDDGAVIVWRVTYDTEEPSDPAAFQSLPKPPAPVGEDGEGEEAAPPAEDDEEEPADEEEAEEEEELDEEGNPKPKMPVVYDSGDEEDLLDGLRMKIHLTLREPKKEKHSAILPWAFSIGLANELAIEAYAGEHVHTAVTPTDELKLHWVYGFSSRIPRAAVKYTSEGRIVYPAGGIGVTYDKIKRKQVHTIAHNDEITCLDVHLASNIAASAHKGAGNIVVSVWDPETGSILRRLDCGEANGASAIAFNPDGSLIAVALQNESHDVLLFDWKEGFLRARTVGGKQKILSLAFSLVPAPGPADPASLPPVPTSFSAKSPYVPHSYTAPPKVPVRILQGGVAHLQLLELKAGRTLSSKVGSFGPDLKKVNATSVAALPVPEEGGSEFVIGLSNGSIGVIARGEKTISNIVPVQKGAITSLCVVKLQKENGEAPAEGDEDLLFKLVTGGTNGFVKVFDQNFEPIAEFNLYRVPELYGNLHQVGRVRGIKSLAVDKSKRKIVYGTAGGEIGEFELSNGKDINAGPLVRSHFRDQLSALAAHPIRQEVLTAGDDKTLCIWNLDTATQLNSIDLPDIARAASFSPNGHLIAVALGGDVPGLNRPRPRPCHGQFAVISYLQGVLNIVFRTNDAADQITSLVFTLDGSKLVAASLDASIYVYDALDNFKLINTLKKHSEGVISLDVSSEGRYLVSTGTKSEVMVWDLMFWAVLPDSEKFSVLEKTAFAVRQGTFGYDTLGAFPYHGSAEDVLAVAKSNDNSLLVTGDVTGLLQLRSYPAKSPGAPAKTYQGHTAGGVARTSFSLGDKYLVSIGRDDRVILQWEVVRSANRPEPAEAYTEKQPPASSTVSVGKEISKDSRTFDHSFDIHGVNFTPKTATPDHHNVRVVLSQALGVGNTFNGYLASRSTGTGAKNVLPVAQYSGSGEILSVHGRTLTAISSGDHVTQRHWHIADATDEIGVIAVSNNSRYFIASRARINPHHNVDPTAATATATTTAAATAAAYSFAASIYASASGALLSELSVDLPGEVTALAFSKDDKTVAVLCGDRHHSLLLYSTANGDWTDTLLLNSSGVSEANTNVISFISTSRPPYSSVSGHVDLPPPPLQSEPDPNAPPKSPAKKRIATKKSPADDKKGGSTEEKTGSSDESKAGGKDGDDGNKEQDVVAIAAPAEDFDFVTGGAGHLRFWRIYGRNVTSVIAEIEDGSSLPAVTAVSGLADLPQAVTGDITGGLWQWIGRKRGSFIGSHTAPVTGLRGFTAAWGRGVISAASDSIKLWDAVTLSSLREFSLSAIIEAVGLDRVTPKNVVPVITSIATDALCNRLLLTLSTSALLEVAVDSGSAVVLAEGLSNRPAAFAAHPTEPNTVVTSDHDNLLKVWDISPCSRGVTAVVPLPRFASALAFSSSHPNILAVAIAGNDSLAVHGGHTAAPFGAIELDSAGPSLLLLELHPFHGELPRKVSVVDKVHNVIDHGLVHSLRFSPNGSMLAAGSSDGTVHIYDANANYATLGSFSAHALVISSVAGFDFSADSRYVRVYGPSVGLNKAVEVHIFDLFSDHHSGKAAEITDEAQLKALVSVAWASCSSAGSPEGRAAMILPEENKFGPVLPVPSVSSITAHKYSADVSLLAAGYTDGTVKVYGYPASSSPNSAPITHIAAHAAGAVKTEFTASGQLCTVGVEDGSILVWDVKL